MSPTAQRSVLSVAGGSYSFETILGCSPDAICSRLRRRLALRRRNMIDTLGGRIADLLERIPFPGRLGGALRRASGRMGAWSAQLILALILGCLTAILTFWVAKQPLLYLLPVFGFVSGNDPRLLSFYNTFAQMLAFVVATKVVFATL